MVLPVSYKGKDYAQPFIYPFIYSINETRPLSSKKPRAVFCFLLFSLTSVRELAQSGYVINFPRELIFWDVFLSIGTTLYLGFTHIPTFIYSAIKHILTSLYPLSICHILGEGLGQEHMHIIFIEEGLM